MPIEAGTKRRLVTGASGGGVVLGHRTCVVVLARLGLVVEQIADLGLALLGGIGIVGGTVLAQRLHRADEPGQVPPGRRLAEPLALAGRHRDRHRPWAAADRSDRGAACR